jgi:glycosyltransferase involved in cell wall biosynthesis
VFPTAGRAAGAAVVDGALPLACFDFAGADDWHAVVLLGGVPCARVLTPSPGAVDDAALADALFLPHAREMAATEAVLERLRRRLGAPESPAAPALRCSVVVCTHRRPQYLPAALEALARLDPAPFEVIVVDNDPGPHDCEREVAAAGARYVREDRRGLDNARTTGVRHARGEIVAFTDDDCVPAPGWLRFVAEDFAQPLVAAVTGPAFPFALDTPSRVRMERHASLSRGIRPRALDWTGTSPPHAGQAGAGANITCRREALLALPEAFPPELDAGTPTRSGGDTYLFSRLLAAGRGIVYDPRQFVFHQHRSDPRALHDAIRGYGVGLTATLTKMLVEDRELGALGPWRWLLRQYAETQAQRLAGRADAVDTRLAWNYIEGALGGPRAWRRARRELGPRATRPRHGGAAGRASAPAPGRRAPTRSADVAPSGRPGRPDVSVVVPTAGRLDVLARCLAALERQDLPASSLEVIVVDDATQPEVRRAGLQAGERPTRILETSGSGAAAARNAGARAARGALLLFLDDDLVAAPDLARRHRERHARAEDEQVVVGYSAPRPALGGLAASAAALWWEGHFHRMGTAITLTFTDALSGNVSLPRGLFLATGGFDERYGRFRREDWEWGLRLLERGIALRYEPRAVAAHEFRLTTRGRIAAARAEGRGDALLLARRPDAYHALPVAGLARSRRGGIRHRTARLLLRRTSVQERACALLDLLERARARPSWARLNAMTQQAAYLQGLRAGGWQLGRRPRRTPELWVELTEDTPIPAPVGIAPTLHVAIHGRRVASVHADEGRWNGLLADRLLGAVPAPERKTLLGAHGGETPAVASPPAALVLLAAPDDATPATRRRLEAAGAEVRVLDGPPAARWHAVDAAIRESSAGLVAVLLPGLRADARWLAEAAVAFRGPRVAIACGAGLPDDTLSAPLVLHEDRPRRKPFSLPAAIDYLVVDRDAYAGFGGCAPETAVLGDLAPVMVCIERALAAGRLVAQRDVHGLAPPRLRADPLGPEGARRREWAGLLAAHAAGLPPARRAAWALQGLLALAALRVGGRRRPAWRDLRLLAAGAAGVRRARRAGLVLRD